MLSFRQATDNDVDLFFRWANDKAARGNSYNANPIKYEDHVAWFRKKLQSSDCRLYVFMNEQRNDIGQIRIEKDPTAREAVISISIDADHRGKGYSSEMLEQASADFLNKNSDHHIIAYVFKNNEASYKSFIRAGYVLVNETIVKGIPSYILHKKIT